jgi:hypothetical protein
MSVNLVNHYKYEFANNIDLLLQQTKAKVAPYVSTGSHTGEQASPVDQVAAISMQPVTSRFGPMGRVDADVDRRWVYPLSFELPQLIDNIDKLKIAVQPESAFMRNAMAAANRQKDDIIIDAFFADAKTGKVGGTTVTWAAQTGQVVAVNHGSASNVGLTVAKLREAKRILMANEVDFDVETPTMFVTSKQHDNLLAEAQVISTDFNERPVLVDGRVTRFMGINILHSERLDTDSNSYRRIPVFVKSGMYLGMWSDVQTDISQRKDITGLPWQIYLKMTMGATRIEEKRLVEIRCAE